MLRVLRELEAYQQARQLSNEIFEMTKQFSEDELIHLPIRVEGLHVQWVPKLLFTDN